MEGRVQCVRSEGAIKKELIDELIASSEGSLIGPNALVKELTKALVERMLTGEMNHHLGYEKHEPAGYNSGNSRKGRSTKKLKGDAGEMEIAVPRDHNGTFEPQLIEKHQTRFSGFDDKTLSMYALGMTTRDIQGWPSSGAITRNIKWWLTSGSATGSG